MSEKSYIVQLKDNTDVNKAKAELEASGVKVGHVYDTVFKGFSVTLPENSVNTLDAHPEVQHYEADKELHTMKKD
ncbi:subtilisin cleaved region like protein [Schizosaccharomyces octosporus yFS286]|uniref:Subtilisin cleaved region like protein n=1 Tax=Schizosaccharomyces octosporus (strain yFS286) TaxID=483514 RepID=S9RDI3_SCHOY|nr:subtilisin cleaved region like protein [Schizosaccharomyces octosporus yFS286]EPX72109.1 subtilisin cleaved region like protein [Schizosaccharomyces octosporus yFS286]